ncbi:MAG: hypothetical protein ABSH21_06135 [Verrucomicrobiia bacterium]|jgi:hypothetical protein
MEVFPIIFFLLIGAVAFGLWFIAASVPLTDEEVEALAVKRRLIAIGESFGFTEHALSVNPEFKRNMKADGKLYLLNESLRDFPSLAAGLLKGKKHEWVLFAFARGDRVVAAWANKGEDRTRVAPVVPSEMLVNCAQQLQASTVLRFHNHPNPDPSLFDCTCPSRQDQVSAELFGRLFVSMGLPFLDFVTERGLHYQFGCWVPDAFVPFGGLLDGLRASNGQSRFMNLDLRRELRRRHRTVWLLSRPNASHNLGLERGT